jgi:predicted alpha/beta hydrolase family esterase
MKRVVLLHGNGGGSGHDQWFPYIKRELEKLGVPCETPDLPDPELARSKYWLPYFENELKLGPNDIVVGHSSGALAILKYAEEHQIGASVLIGAYYTDLGYEDEKNSGYFDTPWQWDKIKANQEWTAIFASTDDPFIPIAEPRYIRDQLMSEYFEFNNQGHFGLADKPKREFPELLHLLRQKLL